MPSPRECAGCTRAFDGDARCPRLLPACGHTFCTACLAALVAGGCVVCPTDGAASRATCAADLPRNIAILELTLLPAHGRPHSPPPSYEESNTSNASPSLAAAAAAAAKSDRRPLCAEHSHDVVAFDTECGCGVCVLCLSLAHHGHKCKTLRDAAADLACTLRDRTAQLKGVEAGAMLELEAIEASFASTHREVFDTFKEVSW